MPFTWYQDRYPRIFVQNTTAERDAFDNPPPFIMIFNLTTRTMEILDDVDRWREILDYYGTPSGGHLPIWNSTEGYWEPRALVDADIPAAIARDAEVTSAIGTHAAEADPHTGYQKESEVERGFTLGIAGSIPVATAQFADFPFIAAHSGTLLRMKAIVKTAVSVTKTIRLRKATAAGGYTDWADVTGFVVSLTAASNGGYVEVVDPANVAFAEGDAFQLETEDVNAASGTNLVVLVVYSPT